MAYTVKKYLKKYKSAYFIGVLCALCALPGCE